MRGRNLTDITGPKRVRDEDGAAGDGVRARMWEGPFDSAGTDL